MLTAEADFRVGEVELCEAKAAADVVALVGMKEERHALRTEVAIAVFGA